MNGTEAVVLLFFMGVFAVTAKIAHGVKKGDIVMMKPTLSVIAESLGLTNDESKDTEERVWTMTTYLHGKTPYYVELADYEDVLELHRLLCDLGHQIDDPPIAWVTENGSKNLWDFDLEELV